MKSSDLANLIKSRRSVRRWQNRRVSEELLKHAIELATWAPNGGNQQNWYFYIIVNGNIIKAIADSVQNSVDLMASWPEATEFKNEIRKWQERASFFHSAPAAIAVTISRYQSLADKLLAARQQTDSYAAKVRKWRETVNSSLQSASAAIAYLLLVLHQMGLGAVWMTGPMQAKGEIEQILSVPPEIDLIAFIPVGYSAQTPVEGDRRPITEICEVMK